jgi:hypothetical protein
MWSGAASLAKAGAVSFAAAGFVLAYMLAYRWIPPVVMGTLPFEWRRRIS